MGYNLVGGFKHGFYFPFHIWDVILPIDFHIFQRGRYTTNQLIVLLLYLNDLQRPKKRSLLKKELMIRIGEAVDWYQVWVS